MDSTHILNSKYRNRGETNMFYTILVLHLLAVSAKLIVLLKIPRLKNAEQTKQFLQSYRKWDITADVMIWITGLSFFFVTTFAYLMQTWLLVSMFLYMLIFFVMKKVLIRGLNKVVDSGKVHAETELKTLRVQNVCIAVFMLASLAGIGYLMATKPF
jgi:Zn-dependent protease with chaperone function